MECIFCKIIAGQLPADKVYEDEKILAFRDVNPSAPVHVLVIPKKHIASANHVQQEDRDLIGHIFLKATEIARQQGCLSGYRIIVNCGKWAEQTVDHLHFHVLGDKGTV